MTALRSRLALLVCGVALVAALVGGSARAGAGAGVSVQLELTNEFGDTESFSLSCRPPRGTLPLRDRICRAIRLYPDVMLHPNKAFVGYSGGSPDRLHLGPVVKLRITAHGATSSFRGVRDGRWGYGFELYYCAIRNDTSCVARFEKSLAARRSATS